MTKRKTSPDAAPDEDITEFGSPITVPPEAKINVADLPDDDDGNGDAEEISFSDEEVRQQQQSEVNGHGHGHDFDFDVDPEPINGAEHPDVDQEENDPVPSEPKMKSARHREAKARDLQIKDLAQDTTDQMSVKANNKQSARPKPGSGSNLVLSVDDFYAYMLQSGAFIFTTTREIWPAASVNARVPPIPVPGSDEPIPAAVWLKSNRPVEQMTWAPGLPMLIRDRLIVLSGWIEKSGATCFNQYLPPTIALGDPDKADPWLDHVRKVYPNDAAHIIRWLAHRVQRPHEKINHALVFGGKSGVGKDTILEPVKRAIGPWNFQETSPQQMLGRFNGFLKSVILRISEAHDVGSEFDRYAFHHHMKAYTAAPPDALLVDEKHIKEHYILNCTGIIITSNEPDSLYLPPDDRRHYVAWTDLEEKDFKQDYWDALWRFYNTGGDCHVAAFLHTLDLSSFNARAPPLKTAAFWQMVNVNRAPEEGELADVLERLGHPKAITIGSLILHADAEFAMWLRDRKNRRAIPHRLQRCDYVAVRNDAAKDGLWKINGMRQVIYARKDLTPHDQIDAAKKL
jgi:hypothetical protein